MSVMTLTPELTRVGRHRAPEASRLRGNAWWTLAAVSIGVIMVGLDASVVTIANPRIAADLHASLSDLQWITDAYLLALASLLIFGGKLGDRFGRREIFFIGVAGFALTSIGIGMIGTVAGVIGLRALQGLFGALLMPSTLAIIRSTFPPEKLNTAVGIWGAASGVSIAAGPIVGGLLVEHVNWQSVFYINAPIALAALVIGAMAIVESRSEHAHHLDVPGIVALSGGLSLIVFGLIKAQNWGWLAGETLAVIAAGVLALVMFGVIELRSVEPLLPMRLFANRSLSIGTAVVVINFFALFGALFFMTLYLQNVHGFSPFDAGVRTLPLSLALMVSAPLSGVVTERFGPRAVAGVRAVGCRHRARADGELRCDRRQRERRRRRRGGRSSEPHVQLGGVLGTTILGSVLSSRVGSVLFGELTAAGTPEPIAAKLEPAKELIAQGVAPSIPGAPAPLSAAIAEGSHSAFMAGLHTSLTVAAVAAACGAVLAMLCVANYDPSSRSAPGL